LWMSIKSYLHVYSATVCSETAALLDTVCGPPCVVLSYDTVCGPPCVVLSYGTVCGPLCVVLCCVVLCCVVLCDCMNEVVKACFCAVMGCPEECRISLW
jgi:hypothetical protein